MMQEQEQVSLTDVPDQIKLQARQVDFSNYFSKLYVIFYEKL